MAEIPFKKVLIANRSEIAVRVINACRVLGLKTVSVYSDADRNAKHRWMADESVHIGAAPPTQSYLNVARIIEAARSTNAGAIHPGYGFLSEKPELAEACLAAGIVFVGPSAENIRLMGDKLESRRRMIAANVPVTPGMSSVGDDPDAFSRVASEIGYPVLVKASAGGGGKGMRIVRSESELKDAVESARRESEAAFGDNRVYIEKYLQRPRHIEFQVFADSHGNCVHLFERECSIQRRHQKIIEESPSTALTPELRMRMGTAAVRAAQSVKYVNAGTVEFLLDEQKNYYFLEMNTRIQVEHPITEVVTGTDLVVEQLRVAAGLPLSELVMKPIQRGHAIECRIYAEDGENNFMPSTGTILQYSEPAGPGIRVDSGVALGSEISIDYDPIMAKLIVHAPTRPLAIAKMQAALHDYNILGVRTSKRLMVDVLKHDDFRSGKTHTGFLDELKHRSELQSEAKAALVPVAACAAAVAGVASSSAGTVTMSSTHEAPTVWQQLGNWEIGR